jgi:NADPH:quinone reductase-like Zn-dependent oxidoreductase
VPEGITAATDMFGTETAEAALVLGVAPERISTIAAGPNPPGGVRATGGFDAKPGALAQIAESIVSGEVTLPIAATFPLEQIHEAVALQAGRHVHGKIVVTI